MEAGTATRPTALPAPEQAAERARGGAVGDGLREVGEMARFGVDAAAALPGSWRYFGEALRQASLLITGSALVVIGMMFVIGAECGLFTSYFSRAFGASGATGLFTHICDVREMFPYMFGYILAAKVGCGLTAEIGSMRISEEIDALETMGVPPMRYLVATRIIAALIALPIIYVIAIAFGTLGSYLIVVHQVGDVSAGAWAAGHFGPIHGIDENLYSLLKAMTIAMAVILVALFFGYRARGGPVGVGSATAKSMIVNLVLIHLIGGTMSIFIWGTDSRLPLGG